MLMSVPLALMSLVLAAPIQMTGVLQPRLLVQESCTITTAESVATDVTRVACSSLVVAFRMTVDDEPSARVVALVASAGPRVGISRIESGQARFGGSWRTVTVYW